MGKSKNEVTLMGNIGQDPELKMTTGGAAVCKFSLATSERYKDRKSGEYKDSPTQWHRCELWGKSGEAFAKMVSKGSSVMVEGKIEYQDFQAGDGSKKTATVIKVNEFFIMANEKSNPASNANNRGGGDNRKGFGSRDDEEDIPF